MGTGKKPNIWRALLRGDPKPFYWAGARWLIKKIYRPQYIGFEKIPTDGPALLIANHVSYVDGVIITAGIERPVRYIIDEFIYRLPIIHYFLKRARAIPILPKRDRVQRALDEVSSGLKNGDAICIFPEGQLTYTGSLGRFKPGIEWMVKRDPVPIYPIAITGLWGSVFSRKYLKSPLLLRIFPRSFGREVRAVCGDPIPSDKVNVNLLQREIIRLKYTL